MRGSVYSINRLAQGKCRQGHTLLARGTGPGLDAVVHERKRDRSCESMRKLVYLWCLNLVGLAAPSWKWVSSCFCIIRDGAGGEG